jgi:hypothetical protein
MNSKALERLAFLRRHLPSHGTHGEEMFNAFDTVEAALRSAVPEGEPTEEMLDAGIDAFMAAAKEQANAVGRVPQSVALKAAYKAMFTAAGSNQEKP